MSTTLQRHGIAGKSRDAQAGGRWGVARRVKDDVVADNLSMSAAGAAFFGLLALFPLAATVASARRGGQRSARAPSCGG